MIGTACLVMLMVIATITDVREQKIYNWNTYSGMGLALLIGAIQTWLNVDWISDVDFLGSVIGLLSCGSIMLICFVLFQIGGGDVKLLAMVGAFTGPQLGIEALLWTFVLGGATAMILLIWRIGAATLIQRAIHQLGRRINRAESDSLTEEEKNQLSLPLFLAPSALVATLIVRFQLAEQLALWIE